VVNNRLPENAVSENREPLEEVTYEGVSIVGMERRKSPYADIRSYVAKNNMTNFKIQTIEFFIRDILS